MPRSPDGKREAESKPRKARYTIDFDVEALKALKHLAVDLEVDASDILKYLVARATESGALREEIERHFLERKS